MKAKADLKKHSLADNMKYVLKKMVEYDKKVIGFMIIILSTSIVMPIIATLIPTYAVKLITDGTSIRYFLVGMGIVTSVYLVVGFFKAYISDIMNMENTIIRIKIFYMTYTSKLLNTDYTNVETSENQILSQKANTSMESNWVGPELMMKYMIPTIVNVLGMTLYASLLFNINGYIVLILIAMTVCNFLLSKNARNYEEKHKEEYAKYDKKTEYLYNNAISLANGKDVRIYKMETWFQKLFHELIKKRVSWFYKVEIRYLLPDISDTFFLFFRDALAYIILINMYVNGKLTISEFTFYNGIIMGFSNWLNGAVSSYTNLLRANLGVNDYRAYLEKRDIFNHEKGIPLEELKVPVTIEFKNVSFYYPGSDKATINNLNLKIKAGEKLALVGMNGAGKTSIVKLLCGFYQPDKGEILINDRRIEEYNIYDYYKIIGVVFQEGLILALTIAQNIACDSPESVDTQKVWECLELAGLKDKVMSLKDKEKTYISQILKKDGVILSGGELQKLMLARALYKDAPIMVLDEPTSALDPIAEADIYEKYCSFTKNKTSIFISHRLCSTRFCDRIIFLEDGSVVEEGSHTQLMQRGGKYAEMFEVQSQYYKENGEVINHE